MVSVQAGRCPRALWCLENDAGLLFPLSGRLVICIRMPASPRDEGLCPSSHAVGLSSPSPDDLARWAAGEEAWGGKGDGVWLNSRQPKNGVRPLHSIPPSHYRSIANHIQVRNNEYTPLSCVYIIMLLAWFTAQKDLMFSHRKFIKISNGCRPWITGKLDFFKEKFPLLTSSPKGKQFWLVKYNIIAFVVCVN